ncbi:MAG: hypothetical protein VKL39_19095 [Leptolyngbyaceae bacterium]|nr:hypothetical protein [Leptolyngbyaceae bacterium]
MLTHSPKRLLSDMWFCLNGRRLMALVCAAFVFMMCEGCTAGPAWLQNPFAPISAPDIELAILKVEPTSRPGVYAVTGNTTLPDQSQITVAAIRLLNEAFETVDEDRQPTYEILDRQFADVENGQWSARLNLWRIDADGDFQETWQITQQRLATQFEPSPEVTFSATFDPAQQFPGFQDVVEEGSRLAKPSLAQYNSDGEVYLQASRKLSIALPTGGTVPLESSSSLVKVITREVDDPINAVVSSETSDEAAIAQSRSDAPLSPEEFLR